ARSSTFHLPSRHFTLFGFNLSKPHALPHRRVRVTAVRCRLRRAGGHRPRVFALILFAFRSFLAVPPLFDPAVPAVPLVLRLGAPLHLCRPAPQHSAHPNLTAVLAQSRRPAAAGQTPPA